MASRSMPRESSGYPRAYRYRINPTPSQAEALDHWMTFCRNLYNAMVAQRVIALSHPNPTRRYIRHYGPDGQQAMVAEKAQQLPPEYYAMPSSVRQDVSARVELTFQRWYQRQSGPPRFQSWRRYSTFRLPSPSGWSVNPARATIRINRIGDIPLVLHRPLLGDPRTLTIAHAAGRWYAIITCRDVPVPEGIATSAMVGIDLRVAEHLLATSDGELIENPHYLEQSLKQLARVQRKMARQQRGSQRREETIRQIQRIHEHIANQRREMHHRVSHDLIQRYAFIAVEDISPDYMVERRKRDPYPREQARRALDTGWGQFLSFLTYKAEAAGRIVVRVDPAYTSRTCSQCGVVTEQEPFEREFSCPACGHREHRAINAARNILAIGLRDYTREE